MKKTPTIKSRKRNSDDLLPEYRFDYSKAKPNRFASRDKTGYVVVMLDPEVAQVFKTPESVNHALKSLIEAMPQSGK